VYLGYELLAQIESSVLTHVAPGGLPVALALRCPVVLIHDQTDASVQVIIEDHADSAQWRAQLLQDIADLVAAPRLDPLDRWPVVRVQEDDPTPFLQGVDRIQEYLRAGDVFQVNLSRGWRARAAESCSHTAVYSALRSANPAPFAGLLAWDDWAVLSSSPERLLSVREGLAETRPIAGTRPRQPNDPLDDLTRRAELIGHPKERAEHVMLIDLERNDLGRVCVPGSVQVDELMGLETYAHVHHIVSNVRGMLRADVTPGQAMAAVFPGGTITGCPKVRCMQIIHELESVGRGPYTGALGYLDRRGNLDLNILIRTLWMRDNTLHFRAGAGIVVDSDPESELAETRAKARGLLRALGAA
jgi:anthranilate synthase component 1